MLREQVRGISLDSPDQNCSPHLTKTRLAVPVTSSAAHRDVIDGYGSHGGRVSPQLANIGEPEQVPHNTGAVSGAWGRVIKGYDNKPTRVSVTQ